MKKIGARTLLTDLRKDPHHHRAEVEMDQIFDASDSGAITPSRAAKLYRVVSQAYRAVRERVSFVNEHGGFFKSYGLRK